MKDLARKDVSHKLMILKIDRKMVELCCSAGKGHF